MTISRSDSIHSNSFGESIDFFADLNLIQKETHAEACVEILKEKLTTLINGLNHLNRSAPQLKRKTRKFYSSWRNSVFNRTQELNAEVQQTDLVNITKVIKDEFSRHKILQNAQTISGKNREKKLEKLVVYIQNLPQVASLTKFVTNFKLESLKVEAELICKGNNDDFIPLNWEPCRVWAGRSAPIGQLALNPKFVERFSISNVERSLCPGGNFIPKSISINNKEIIFEKEKDSIDDILRRIAIYTDFYNNDYDCSFDVWKSKSIAINEVTSPSLSYHKHGFTNWINEHFKTTCLALKIDEEDGKDDLKIKLSQYWHIKKLCEFFPVLNLYAEMTINAGGEKIMHYREILPEIFTYKQQVGAEFYFKKVEGSTCLNIDFNPAVNKELNAQREYIVSQIEEFDVLLPDTDSYEKNSTIARIALAWRTTVILPSSKGIAARTHFLDILNVSVISGSPFEKVAKVIEILLWKEESTRLI